MVDIINLDEPRWDQTQYWGRAKYFFTTTNPLNIFKSNAELERCKHIVDTYKKENRIIDGLTLKDLYKAKDVVDSAYHPETGEKMIIFGRMSAQVPMNMIITGCMITFYKSTPAVIFWQWANQSFNSLVNYTNRSGNSSMSIDEVSKSYLLATSGALVTALSLNKLVKRLPTVIGRFVPFAAVAAANCINIPLMRKKELNNGIEVYDENKQFLGSSQSAAYRGIGAVVFSRIVMASPGMIVTPVIMEAIERKGLIKNFKWASAPIQTILCGIILTFSTPLCCALFPQISPISIEKLEPELQSAAAKCNSRTGFYNKGL
ncbi:sideroflexin-1 [Daktulosphaira vitifoliae]|uniref:sideroflexin-1 n=1 Tax=Daktulosphaira vitifoliae TaxID=58002 RepID=UPI0021AA390A|nr:sideroflexin-1 [Daktulosphaira vitifoliae]